MSIGPTAADGVPQIASSRHRLRAKSRASAKCGASARSPLRKRIAIVIGQLVAAEHLKARAGSPNPPWRLPGGKGRALRPLHAALEIDVEPVLFRVGRAGQHDIGAVRASVAMGALINHKSLPEGVHVNLIGTQKIDEIDLSALGACEYSCHVASPRTRHKAQIEPRHPRCRNMQDVEPFQPPSAARPGGPIMPVSAAIRTARLRISAPSDRASAPGPRISIGRFADFSTSEKGCVPSAIWRRISAVAPSCCTG